MKQFNHAIVLRIILQLLVEMKKFIVHAYTKSSLETFPQPDFTD